MYDGPDQEEDYTLLSSDHVLVLMSSGSNNVKRRSWVLSYRNLYSPLRRRNDESLRSHCSTFC